MIGDLQLTSIYICIYVNTYFNQLESAVLYINMQKLGFYCQTVPSYVNIVTILLVLTGNNATWMFNIVIRGST